MNFPSSGRKNWQEAHASRVFCVSFLPPLDFLTEISIEYWVNFIPSTEKFSFASGRRKSFLRAVPMCDVKELQFPLNIYQTKSMFVGMNGKQYLDEGGKRKLMILCETYLSSVYELELTISVYFMLNVMRCQAIKYRLCNFGFIFQRQEDSYTILMDEGRRPHASQVLLVVTPSSIFFVGVPSLHSLRWIIPWCDVFLSYFHSFLSFSLRLHTRRFVFTFFSSSQLLFFTVCV